MSMDRREFLAGLVAASVVFTFKGFASTAGSKRSPNVVYILADDLGWGDLGVYNPYSGVPTPNMDRLASQGMRFNDMHSSSALCTPSRYSILTGRYCWRTRLKRGVLRGDSPNLIDPGRMTVASMLKSAGYYTAGVGKWHLGLGDGEKTDFSKPLHPGPIDHGFDYFFGIPASLDMDPYLYFENDHVVESATVLDAGRKQPPRGVFWREGLRAPHFDIPKVLPTLTDKAVDLIHQRADDSSRPFFLYVALPAPHTPWVPLAEYRGKSHAGDYGDYVFETDAMIGRILRALEETDLENNTLVVVTSDNGAEWKPEDIEQYAHRANAEWRGEKCDVWEGGHRIPFVVRWPGHVRANTVSAETGSLTDFMATMAAIINFKLPDDAAEDSFNLLPAFLQKNKAPIRDTIIDHSGGGMFTIRQGNWKLELGLGSGGFSAPIKVQPVDGGVKGQLYDLQADPHELNNLWNKRPDIVSKLTALLEKYQKQGHTRY